MPIGLGVHDAYPRKSGAGPQGIIVGQSFEVAMICCGVDALGSKS